MNASKWCAGYRRDPHVPSGGLVLIDAERALYLCREHCWRIWNSHNGMETER